MKHFTPTEADCIRKYKYVGGDYSYMYTYVYNPICEILAKHSPHWLHPNIITLASLIVLATTHTLITLYAWNFTACTPSPANHVPAWVCYFAAVGYFVYNVLDTLDGKQARNTHSSSPLGMMFDHGTDAIGSVLTVCNFIALSNSNEPVPMFLLFFSVAGGFYLATYETYHTCEMYLYKFTPVSDGSVVIILLYAFSGLLGNGFLPRVVYDSTGLHITMFVIITGFLSFMQNFFAHPMQIAKICKKTRFSYSSPRKALVQTLVESSYAILIILATMCTNYAGYWKSNPRLMIYAVGSLLTALNVYTLSMQVSSSRMRLHRGAITDGVVVLVLVSIVGMVMGSGNPLYGWLPLVGCGFCVLRYAFYHVSMMKELRDLLGIQMFRVKYQAQ